VHPVLRSAIEANGVRAGLRRVAHGTMFPLLRLFAIEFRAAMLRLFAYGAALGTLGLMAAEFVTTPRGTVIARAAPQRDWIEVARPFPAFAVSIPEFDAAPRYAIQRHAGGGRKDIITFGDPNAGAGAAVEIYRPGSEAENLERDDTTGSVPDLRLSRPTAPRSIDTKFGAVALDEFTDQHGRRCLRFARSFEEPRLEISGRFCNAGLELVDRGMVACALDRLTLVAAGSDQKLGALFARAELKRSFCGQQSVFVAATPKRTDWIEAARDPKLRGRQ
jgi:hypothetical protein